MKFDKLMTVLNWAGFPLIVTYLFSMFVYPFLEGDWGHAQKVWNNWQSLNVGFLAFASSLIAFNISRYNSEKQREREFVVAKSFLPQALSDITFHFKLCADVLNEAWVKIDQKGNRLKVSLKTSMPILDQSVKGVFGECIRHGSPVVGSRLANILMQLQVSDSRILGYMKT